MRIRSLLFLSLLAISTACTIEQQGAHTDAEFHPPFTYEAWKTQQMNDGKGHTVCTVSSGANGHTFVIRKTSDGNVVSVQSNRFMQEGTLNTITVNGHRYETNTPTFSAQDALALSQDFSVADKAYSEWSELRGLNGYTRYSVIYKLKGFKEKFDACLNK